MTFDDLGSKAVKGIPRSGAQQHHAKEPFVQTLCEAWAEGPLQVGSGRKGRRAAAER